MELKENIVINCCKFNNTYDCLFCGTQDGLIIYDIEPFRQLFKKNIEGGITLGTIYNKSNILFLIGTGINPDYPPNRCIIWDINIRNKICSISINEKIEGFNILNKHIFIYSKQKGYIYNFDTLKLKHKINLVSNGLSCNIQNSDIYILSHPLINYNNIGNILIKTNTDQHIIKCHSDTIEKIAISYCGTKIITCSNKGLLIKLYYLHNQELINTYHRGYVSKNISYLGFSLDNNWIICATKHSSIHLFKIELSNDNILLNLLRQRPTYSYTVKDTIIDCTFNTNTGKIYFNSLYKFYSGIINNNILNIKQSQILLIENDPFSLSPKYIKGKI